MSGTDRRESGPDRRVPVADTNPRRSLPLIWLVPLVAALIAAYLGWRTLSEEGPEITITFRAADGLTAGQTRVKHKAVDLGTVGDHQSQPGHVHTSWCMCACGPRQTGS